MFLLAINNDIEMLLSEIPGQNNLQHRRQAIDPIYYRKSFRFLPKHSEKEFETRMLTWMN